nr:hypothetical protein [Tanacetum cinerariifolium]
MDIPRNCTVKEAQNIRRDRQIEVLQEHLDRVLQMSKAGVGRNRGNGGNGDLSEESSENNKSSSKFGASLQRRRHNRKRRDDSRDIKVDPLKFEGSSNPDEFLEWVQTMDIIIMVKGYYGKKALKLSVVKLKKGLNSTIAEELELQPLWTFEDVCKMSIMVDKQAKKMCHGFGHFQAQWPNQRALTLKEIEHLQGKIETKDEQPIFYESNEEETVRADCGGMLVVRRAIHMVEAPKDKNQKENIFHSRCTVKGKCMRKKGYNVPSLVKPLLREFADMFPKELPLSLPPIRGIEHQINLIPWSILPNKEAYRCSPHRAKELQKQVDELVAQGYVRAIMSLCFVPALLIQKDGSMRMCVDSRSINNITIMYRYHIRRLDDMLDELHGSCVFSKIYLCSGYHHIRMREGDEWKIAFKIMGGLFKWFVMPFGLSNAPSTFMGLMNEVLRPLFGKKHKLYGKLEKCNFMVHSVVFLGYVVSKERIYMDPSKDKLSSTPILALPDVDMLFEIECDASGVGIRVVLVQEKRPLAYFSEKLNGSKFNYSTYDKEFYAMMREIDHWSHYLKPMLFVLYFDHEAGSSNVVVDALFRRHSMLSILEARVLRFSFIKELYESDPDFGPLLCLSPNMSKVPYAVQEGFLFKNGRLCIPKESIRDMLIREAYGGGLAGHSGNTKTLEIMNEHFYWPCMIKDVQALITRCSTYHQAKSTFHKVILNGDSPVPTRLVEGVAQPVAPTTVEQKLARKNELKARGTLLMALPDKHQLKFNSHKDAKSAAAA